jgi:uncharacterized protein (TIGR00369 family)
VGRGSRAGREGSVHGQCFACGSSNPEGLRLRFALEDGSVVARCVPDERFQGYRGVLQGGIVSLLLDSAMINCLFRIGVQAVTTRLSVRFARPVETGVPLTVRAALVTEGRPGPRHRRIYALRAAIEQAGIERASATGRFMPLPRARGTRPAGD